MAAQADNMTDAGPGICVASEGEAFAAALFK